MRTWNDVVLYQPDKKTRYRHIDSLFWKTVNWSLIKTQWKDMMQVVLSIQARKVLSSMLLRKLDSNNRHNKLYGTFRELGQVAHTIFAPLYLGGRFSSNDPSGNHQGGVLLQELGGWATFKMVLRYAHLATDRLKSAASKIEGTILAQSSNEQNSH